MAGEDPRLARLYDYTKFHIGIYIVAATTMITILATEHQSSFLTALVKDRALLFAALACMGIAGAAGGIIVSCCAIARTFEAVWDREIGPWGRKLWPGRRWARLEHASFWISVVLFALAALLT